MWITIDGVSGQGKSSIAKKIANDLRIMYIDSGNLYRYLTWLYLKQVGNQEEQVNQILLDHIVSNCLLENDVSENILRSNLVTSTASKIAKIPYVRHFINSFIRKSILYKDAIIVGRDMCVVFPEAEHKFVLQSSLTQRVKLAMKYLHTNANEAQMHILQRDASEIKILFPKDCVIIYLNGQWQSLEAIVHHIEKLIGNK